ncbi:MAG: hypothetical protein ACE5GL_11530, partial [Calditrichia bacterium]
IGAVGFIVADVIKIIGKLMKIIPGILFVSILFLFLNTTLISASENEGKTGLAFLKVGIGARAAGMGEAFSAVVDDALGTYWNPAALASARGSNASLVYNSWLLDIRSEFGALQIGKHFAFHVYSFHLGDIPVRLIPSENPIETTSAQ